MAVEKDQCPVNREEEDRDLGLCPSCDKVEFELGVTRFALGSPTVEGWFQVGSDRVKSDPCSIAPTTKLAVVRSTDVSR